MKKHYTEKQLIKLLKIDLANCQTETEKTLCRVYHNRELKKLNN